MKTSFLFPHKFKRIGWILFVPALVLAGMLLFKESLIEWKIQVFAFIDIPIMAETQYFQLVENNIADEVCSILLIISIFLITFSREKVEDEYIAKIRMESLIWACYVNYGILLLAVLFVYGIGFYWVLIFNLFTILIAFLIRFNWMKMNEQKELRHEEQA
ncbi:MAG: hypothetical protein EP338_10590 [Bacteroidetes bacterium]|nr:MAG: hypothetical protein EP338_10590 [Bacteroidota bacterium]